MTKLTLDIFNKESKTEAFHYSVEMLSVILSQSKATLSARIKRGDLTPCPDTGKIPFQKVAHHPEVQTMVQSPWDKEHAIKPKRKYNLVELFAGGGG